MLRFTKKETAIINGQYGIVYSQPRIYSVSKGNKRPGEGDKPIHKFHLAHPIKHTYIFNVCHTYEKYVNRWLRAARMRWEEAQNIPFLFPYAWDEEKETAEAMRLALEDIECAKSRLASPVSTFEPLEVPDIGW